MREKRKYPRIRSAGRFKLTRRFKRDTRLGEIRILLERIAHLALAVTIGLGAVPLSLKAQQDARAVRVRGEEPVIDGKLDDPAWEDAPPVTQFIQREPVEGAAVSESTEVRFVYNDRALFVAFRGFDREPDRIVGRLVRRDQRIVSDYFNLFLDTYYDRRTAFEFSINPSGARRDVFIYDDGGGRDESWDPVYDWATRVDSLGWTVELRIPFSQLRFPRRDSLIFGLRLRRAIVRRREEANWPFFPRDRSGEVSYFGRLVGITGIPAPQRVEFLPYTAGSARFEPVEDGNPFSTGRRTGFRGGADLKVGLGSALTLDLTVNPDFGQVEADPAVVNLTAFETFFPEKRPFFVEGVNLFRFPLSATGSPQGEMGGGGGGGGGGFGGGFGGGGFFGGGGETLVYTRRIGRSPQLSPEVPPGGYAGGLDQTTILGAGKVSGQFGGGWAVGFLQAVTAKETVPVVDSSGVRARSPVEPLTSYSVFRLQRNTNNGRLAYGIMATGMLRDLEGPRERPITVPCSTADPTRLVPGSCVVGVETDPGEPAFQVLRSRAFSGGSDFRWRFGGDRYEIEAALMGSRVEGSTKALLETQKSSARYFQRPDQNHVRIDSTRTSLSGFAANARIAKVTGFLTWDLRYNTRSPGFEVNDLGFLRQADMHQQRAEVELRWLTPGRVFRRFQWSVEEEAEFTYGWERTRTSLQSRANMEFANYWGLTISGSREFEALGTRVLRGGPALLEPASLRIGGNIRSDFRRSVWGNLGGSYTREDESGAVRRNLNAGIRFRPPGSVAFSIEGRLTHDVDDRQFIARRTVGDSTYYVLGRIDRREASLTFGLDLALTPRLSLELYAQPFVSAGRYGPLRLVADPKAPSYAARFDPLESDRMVRPGEGEEISVDVDRNGSADFTIPEPDFRVAALRTNAVLRWEFLPGSTLYLVWQQNREERVPDGSLDFARALGDSFTAKGQQVVAMKVAYWIGL
ncbi:MAG: hypothetical protein KatS3mg081_2691 [Gemmatimonadales bacterium]|nr:MAG: hypothetical protein KatS3mg081_2691 [Gemmatimonadales bacterium]